MDITNTMVRETFRIKEYVHPAKKFDVFHGTKGFVAVFTTVPSQSIIKIQITTLDGKMRQSSVTNVDCSLLWKQTEACDVTEL
jgi:hypothetical protein